MLKPLSILKTPILTLNKAHVTFGQPSFLKKLKGGVRHPCQKKVTFLVWQKFLAEKVAGKKKNWPMASFGHILYPRQRIFNLDKKQKSYPVLKLEQVKKLKKCHTPTPLKINETLFTLCPGMSGNCIFFSKNFNKKKCTVLYEEMSLKIYTECGLFFIHIWQSFPNSNTCSHFLTAKRITPNVYLWNGYLWWYEIEVCLIALCGFWKSENDPKTRPAENPSSHLLFS